MSRYGQSLISRESFTRKDNSESSCKTRVHSPLTSEGDSISKEYENKVKGFHVYQNYEYDLPPNKSIISEEDSPLHRPRPPEQRIPHDPHDYDEVTPSPEASRKMLSYGNSNHQNSEAFQQNGLSSFSSTSVTPTTPSVPRRNKRDNRDSSTPQSSRWSSRLSERLSSVIINPFMNINQNSVNYDAEKRTRNGYKYETCAINSEDNNMNEINRTNIFTNHEHPNSERKLYTCRQMCCVVVVPAIILSLILIALCSLLVYFYMIQEYSQEIDRLKVELQAARDKDGVFLPKDNYDHLMLLEKSRGEEITNITKLLKTKEAELEKFEEMFEKTKVKLEETTEERDKNKRALDCTRTVLHKTETEKQEQIHLVKKHIETECKLSQQAELLMTVSDEATKDLKKVHDKVDRQRMIEKSNVQNSQDFLREYPQLQNQMDSLVGSHIDSHTKFCDSHRTQVLQTLEKRNEEKSQISSTYTETVSRLIETMSQLERASSENMYKEQAWVEKLLKRMRNEADNQAQNFHTFLVEQLLSVATSILAATSNQEKTVNTLSSKMDKHIEGINERLDKFFTAQNSMQAQQVQQADITFTGIVQNTVGLGDVLKAELPEIAQFEKKSAGIREQMVSLLRAQEVMEQKFTSTRNESISNSIKIADSTSELAKQGRTDSINANLKATSLNNEYKQDESIHVEKLVAEKSKAIEQIETDLAIVSQASERLKANAESFVNSGKDAWNNHYEKTEVELREKSDASSNHVQDLQTRTSEARSAILSSQSNLDSMLETHRRSDERNSMQDQAKLSSRCQEAKDFETAFSGQSQTLGHSLRTFVEEDLKQDVPTGNTPMRTDRHFPKKLVHGTPDELRLKTFRSARDVSRVPFENIENYTGDADLDSVISASTNLSVQSVASSPGGQGSAQDSKISSAQLSRQNSEVGYGSGNEENDKENENDSNKNFTKPNSKLKQPANYRVRSTSRNRQQV